MTRINLGIPPAQLTNKHLIAEHRELKRIPNAVAKGKCNLKNIPSQFTLGKGHVSFFYDKLGYLKDRYVDLYNECLVRGFNVQNYEASWDGVPQDLMNRQLKPYYFYVSLQAFDSPSLRTSSCSPFFFCFAIGLASLSAILSVTISISLSVGT